MRRPYEDSLFSFVPRSHPSVFWHPLCPLPRIPPRCPPTTSPALPLPPSARPLSLVLLSIFRSLPPLSRPPLSRPPLSAPLPPFLPRVSVWCTSWRCPGWRTTGQPVWTSAVGERSVILLTPPLHHPPIETPTRGRGGGQRNYILVDGAGGPALVGGLVVGLVLLQVPQPLLLLLMLLLLCWWCCCCARCCCVVVAVPQPPPQPTPAPALYFRKTVKQAS